MQSRLTGDPDDCATLQGLCWGHDPRLLQLAVGAGAAASGGPERPHGQAIAPAGHQLQPPARGGGT